MRLNLMMIICLNFTMRIDGTPPAFKFLGNIFMLVLVEPLRGSNGAALFIS
jgi:hypothetical protein